MSETISPNSTVAQYTIVSKIGEGGMGEVWRARDPKLGRDVAIKVLPASLSADKDRLARFEQEAQAAGGLNHPNILVIYQIGSHDGAPFIVSELLEGESLRDVIGGNSLPQRKAIDYSLQLARGLAAAHEKGIVHRDIKPDNVFITDDGRVKILDFGIAKLLPRRGDGAMGVSGDEDPTRAKSPHQPVAPSPNPAVKTDPGTVMGTVGYMSPEQLKGQAVDHRSDIFSFGAILYEMLSGNRAFRGASMAETMSAILREDPPDLSETNRTISPALELVVRHCLEKNPNERFHSARDLAFAIESLSGSAVSSGQTTTIDVSTTDSLEPSSISRTFNNRFGWIAAGVLLIGLVVAVVYAIRNRSVSSSTDSGKVVFYVQPPPRTAGFGQIAISPDGKSIAVIASNDGTSIIWLRPIDSLEGRQLAGTDGVNGFPFWSPDSRSIGFYTTGNKLKRIDLADGTVRDLGETPQNSVGVDGTWNRDGTILCNGNGGIGRISASGGASEVLHGYESQRGELLRWPRFLPDGKHFLFLSTNGDRTKSELFVGSIDGSERKLLFASDSNAFYSPSHDGNGGHLLFARGSALLAQGFNPDTQALLGEPFRVAERIRVNFNNRAYLSVSDNGTLVYDPSTDDDEGRQLTWYDRSGKTIETVGKGGSIFRFKLSPDERSLSLSSRETGSAANDIVVTDISRGASSRLSSFAGAIPETIWSPDGKYVVWSERLGTKARLLKKLASGVGEAEVLLELPVGLAPTDWSPDGKFILYHTFDNNNRDIWVLPLEGTRTPVPYIQSQFMDWEGIFSPDGKYVAYRSNESGRDEIYVQTFPASSNKWPVSTNGGISPYWPRKGHELLYVQSGKLMAVEIKAGDTLNVGVPQPLFDIATVRSPRTSDYAVSNDGQRLLFISRGADAVSPPIVTILNWSAGLRR